MPITNSSIEYKKIRDYRKHVLLRPDAYGMGSIKQSEDEVYIASKTYHIFKKRVQFNQGLLHIFNEVLTNAIDNVYRSENSTTKMTELRVNIDESSGKITMWNNGIAISIKKDSEEDIFVPEMIFGQLMSSSNYNDKKKRNTAGRNGFGVKLTNIFSKEFKIRIYDQETRKYYEQVWKNNMGEKSKPKIINNPKEYDTNFVEISYIPDFSRFECEGYSSEMLSIITKKILDATAVSRIKVKLNDKTIPIKKFADYAKLYNEEKKSEEKNDEHEEEEELLEIATKDSDVILVPNDDFEVVSFANGVETREGGVHVDAWTESIFRPLLEKFNKTSKSSPKKKKTKKKTTKKKTAKKKSNVRVTIKDVKQFFRVFINARVDKPTFNSQEKTKLTAPKVEAKVSNKHITSLMKWSFVERVEDLLRSRELLSLKKSEKKRGFRSIPNYEYANFSGTKKSLDCSLIICEGLSAKTYVTKGIEVGAYGKKGRDWFGIFPIRGKLLNVRNATILSISKNAEISGLIQVLNLKYETDYTKESNFSTLHYGQVICLTDADYDGMHIEGLIINFFHALFPSLLRRSQPFVVSMRTPIVRIIPRGRKKEEIKFYNMKDFHNYKASHKVIGKIQYFKGLGTSENEQIADSFGEVIVEYVSDSNTDGAINKAFSKANADLRKKWLTAYDPKNVEEPNTTSLPISSFIDKRMILYSIDDCARMIPNVMDGLKQSLRKILYAGFLKNLKYSGEMIKVSQFSGYIAEHTEYHHGEQILGDTIATLAKSYVGSNNIPLFYRGGQFGSRVEGGKDCAASRYIFTKLDMLTRLIFREEDEPLLENIVEEGKTIEPTYYVPIIPMILVNGCKAGIGTGWSCTIPCFNPKDIINCVRIWIKEGNVVSNNNVVVSPFPELVPWYRGFTGKIEQVSEKKFVSYGIVERGDVVSVTELPIDTWTSKFKEFAERLLEEKKIKKLVNHSTATKIHFDIVESGEFRCNVNNLRLKSTINTTNMVLFTKEGRLKLFSSVDEILEYFCAERYALYVKRRKYLIHSLEEQLKYESNKYRFLKEVMDAKLVISKRPEEDVVSDLTKRKYDKKDGKYEYLLAMQIRSFTEQRLRALKKEIDKISEKLENVRKTSENDMWLSELKELEENYNKWLKIIEREDEMVEKKRGRKKKKEE